MTKEVIRIKLKKKRARVAVYTLRMADKICEFIALGQTIKQALINAGPLAPTLNLFWKWLEEHGEFRERYDRARLMQADIHADTMLEMASDAITEPNKASAYKVASDILKWQAAMRNPKLYGDKVQHEMKSAPMDANKLKSEIANLEKELGVENKIKKNESGTRNKQLLSQVTQTPQSHATNPQPQIEVNVHKSPDSIQ